MESAEMKAFKYNNRTYIRLIPGKKLFQSTLIHEVVNRGDIFGMDIETQVFTIIPGKAQVEHIELDSIPHVKTSVEKAYDSMSKPSPLWRITGQEQLDL
jgi:hypothetical protein